jgi:hypothetical protein
MAKLEEIFENYNLKWLTQSKNSSESMPLGGYNIGCNVWVENNDILMYFQQSGCFDENGSMLKAGRLRITLTPNPFTESFVQELILTDGYIQIDGQAPEGHCALLIWVDAYRPIIHVKISGDYDTSVVVSYDTWRNENRHVDNVS